MQLAANGNFRAPRGKRNRHRFRVPLVSVREENSNQPLPSYGKGACVRKVMWNHSTFPEKLSLPFVEDGLFLHARG